VPEPSRGAAPADGAARALSVRLFMGALATQEALAAYLGVKLGLYELLRDQGPATAPELAATAGLAPRYVREWLEQQAVSGLLAIDDPGRPDDERRYRLPPGHEKVLTASEDPLSLVSTALLPLGGVAAALPELLAAFRTGGGVPDAVYGDDWRQGHGGANRAVFTHMFSGWLRALVPDHYRRLSAAPARIADLGCGAGWASIALARAFPKARIDGYDLDAESVAEAAKNAATAGVGDRVTVRVGDALDPTVTGPDGRYDLVCVLDTLHEVAHPVELLAAARRLRAPEGGVVVMDARVAPTFTAPGDEVERFQYATSLLHCLPAGLAEEGSAGTGTVLRPSAVTALATAAGFRSARTFDAPDRFHRLYRLDG
jgi:2-polyprenyl-3-methyl-5-hydroxy-6-metoxy-1,4-benzoquinol methylase